MNITIYSFLIILCCGLVTWLTRIIPFLLVRKLNIPAIILRFLSYVPLCILTALFVQSLLHKKPEQMPEIKVEFLLSSVPTIIVTILTKNLLWIVITGILTVSLIRNYAL